MYSVLWIMHDILWICICICIGARGLWAFLERPQKAGNVLQEVCMSRDRGVIPIVALSFADSCFAGGLSSRWAFKNHMFYNAKYLPTSINPSFFNLFGKRVVLSAKNGFRPRNMIFSCPFFCKSGILSVENGFRYLKPTLFKDF